MADISSGLNNLRGATEALRVKSDKGSNSKETQSGAGFKELLSGTGETQAKAPVDTFKLKFSNHAIERMQQRGVTFTPDVLNKIQSATSKAAEKGSKETLVLTDDTALIVNHKNNMIVTVVDRSALKENVFTNIDATVIV